MRAERAADEEAGQAISPAAAAFPASLDEGVPEEEPLLKNSESCSVKSRMGLYHQVLRILGFCVQRWTQKPESSLATVFLCLAAGLVIGAADVGFVSLTGLALVALALLSALLSLYCACLLGRNSRLQLGEYQQTTAAVPAPPAPTRGDLFTSGLWFRDKAGRTVILRGVNLGGASKLPKQPDGASWRSDGFFDTKRVSFVGRPLALEEADEHLGRLRGWGMTFLRFLVTWEAVEHEGPGIYDQAFLDYLLAIIRKCGDHQLSVFIDPHQDVWSRWTGGDGAPAW